MKNTFEEFLSMVKKQNREAALSKAALAKQGDVVAVERKKRTKEERARDIQRLGLRLVQGGKV